MPDAPVIDPDRISAEEFARLVAAAGDEPLAQAIRSIGTARVLDRIFAQMRERFRPEQALGIDAEAQFLIADGTDEHPYVVAIRDSACSVRRDRVATPRVTLAAALVPFARLVTGNADGSVLFMTGRLKISGDLVFSLRLLGLFDRPQV